MGLILSPYSPTIQVEGEIHPKDRERMLIFSSFVGTNEWKSPQFRHINEYKQQYDHLNDNDKSQIVARGGDGIVFNLKNNENLVVKKVSYTRLHQAWSQYVVMQSTNILLYENVYSNSNERRGSGTVIYVMEKLQYTLSRYVLINKKGIALTEQDAKSIIFDVLNCLYKIHESHHVHCDLNPPNIMYREHAFVKNGILYPKGWVIIDYGSMKRCVSCGRGSGFHNWCFPSEIIRAKPRWMPPEFENCDKIYPCVDLWAIGAIILFILFGMESITSRENNEKLVHYLSYLQKTSKISNDLYYLLKYGLLPADPKKRIQSVQELYQSSWFDSIRNTDKNGESAHAFS